SLRTRLVTLDSGSLTVNAKVDGELRFRVLDERGEPIPGFDWSEGAPIRGDSVAHPMIRAEQLAELADRAVRLEFSLREAQLYGFDLCTP
ncbi:MAG: hypothetical protein V1800_05045, partial [Candidatus Latescibacterota bacterium]